MCIKFVFSLFVLVLCCVYLASVLFILTKMDFGAGDTSCMYHTSIPWGYKHIAVLYFNYGYTSIPQAYLGDTNIPQVPY